MDVIHPRCAGLDVHKKSVTACARLLDSGNKVTKRTQSYATMTRDILKMADWLDAEGVTHVAMESTGVYWKPIYNLLESRFVVLLCNAKHIKQVPGRKTDVKDSEWIAQLLQYGLLTASFVPDKPQREMRDLTRHRAQLVSEKTRVANRIQKTLEDANIKLSSVASDVLGTSGRDMIQAMIAGENSPAIIADLARRRLRGKIPELEVALEGQVTEHHRFMLKALFDHLVQVETFIEQFDDRLENLVAPADEPTPEAPEAPLPFGQAVQLLATVPGIDRCTAENVVAEIGTNMAQFPSAGHLASWTGICPGNNESAGKQKSGRTTKGNRWLRRALSQAAWGASHTKKSYFASQYKRLAARRGKKRAIIAVAHSLLTVIYHMLQDRKPFEDLGADYFDRLDPSRQIAYLTKRLESFGKTVTLGDLEERPAEVLTEVA